MKVRVLPIRFVVTIVPENAHPQLVKHTLGIQQFEKLSRLEAVIVDLKD